MTRIGKGSSVNDRTILPIPDPVYDGPVYEDAKDPRARFEPITPLRPPAGAPNVLVVLLDDVGFGASSAFGGPCRTPVAERLAHEGLSYSRFHTTALCAPTRQALLTGRNHHAVGMGAITEVATSAPGYTSVRPHSRRCWTRKSNFTRLISKTFTGIGWKICVTGVFLANVRGVFPLRCLCIKKRKSCTQKRQH